MIDLFRKAIGFFAVIFVSGSVVFGDTEPIPELDPAPEGSFTIAVIPDTHAGSKRNNEFFDNHTKWIVENIDSQRIVFVTHVGDIVNGRAGYGDCENIEPWHVARRCMDRLHGRVPYAFAIGNHDIFFSDSSRFQEFFPASRFSDFEWYGGFYPGDPERPEFESGNNANSYQLFSAEGHDFVFLHIECNAPDNVLEWVGEVLEKYADRLAFLSTHMDLGPLDSPNDRTAVDEEGELRSAGWHMIHSPKGRMLWSKNHGDRGNAPQDMWDKLYRHHENLRVIFSGDQSRTETMYQVDTGDKGNDIHALMSDYRGVLRLCRFMPEQGKVRVITLNSADGTLVRQGRRVKDEDSHQFTFDMNFKIDVQDSE